MSPLPHNDYEESAGPINTGTDTVHLDNVDHTKLVRGVRKLLKQKPLITVSLMDRMLGNNATPKTEIKRQMPEGTDINRFDDRLQDTIKRG